MLALLGGRFLGDALFQKARDLFGETWPADIADPIACDLFWSWRDATRFYDALASDLPSLHCLLVFNEADHVQAADEHPHIQQAYDHLRAGTIWSRLNPDEVCARPVTNPVSTSRALRRHL